VKNRVTKEKKRKKHGTIQHHRPATRRREGEGMREAQGIVSAKTVKFPLEKNADVGWREPRNASLEGECRKNLKKDIKSY